MYKSSATLYAHIARTQKLVKTDRDTGLKFRTGSLMEVHSGETDPILLCYLGFNSVDKRTFRITIFPF